MTRIPLPPAGEPTPPLDAGATPPAVPRWEHFAHQADIGVRGIGRSLEEAFEQAALALAAVITPPEQIRPAAAVEIACDAPDAELLLAEWLNALVNEMATRRMLFGACRVRIDGGRLTAVASGEPVEALRHEPAVEVKGATYTALHVAREDDGTWLAQCVVDV